MARRFKTEAEFKADGQWNTNWKSGYPDGWNDEGEMNYLFGQTIDETKLRYPFDSRNPSDSIRYECKNKDGEDDWWHIRYNQTVEVTETANNFVIHKVNEFKF